MNRESRDLATGVLDTLENSESEPFLHPQLFSVRFRAAHSQQQGPGTLGATLSPGLSAQIRSLISTRGNLS